MSSRNAVPDIVLLHGWGLSGAVWEDTALWLTQRGRVTVVDLPGHGAHRQMPLADTLDAVLPPILARAPPRAVWIGWSLGGLLALAAALTAIERVAALVLVCATPRFVQAPDWPWAMNAQVLESFSRALTADYLATLHRFLALQVKGADHAATTLRRLRTQVAAQPPTVAALGAGLHLLRTSDLSNQWQHLRCPLLGIYGQRDTLVPAAVATQMATRLPQAHTVVLPGAGHAPFLSHPQAFRDCLGPWLDTHERG